MNSGADSFGQVCSVTVIVTREKFIVKPKPNDICYDISVVARAVDVAFASAEGADMRKSREL